MSSDNLWRDDAACLSTDPDAMQPESATPTELELAMRVCDPCPVRRQCRDLALSQPGGAYGVHAGLWYGEPPANPDLVECQWCGLRVDRGVRGTRQYCGATCRKAAQRAREAVAIPA